MFKTELQKKVTNRLFVTPKAGVNFSGVLIKAGRTEQDWSTFADVKVHLPNSNPEPAQGDLMIQNSNVAYVQVLPPVEHTVNNVTYLSQVVADNADD